MSTSFYKFLGNMSMYTILYLTSFTLILALLLITPVHGQTLQVDVWTNKGGKGINNLDGGTYVYGEQIYIYYSINMHADRVRLIIIFPDGSVRVVVDRQLPAGTYFDVGTIGGIPGVRIVRLEVWSGNQFTSDEVRYNALFCPSHGMYLGVDIRILNDEDLELTGWFRPTGVSWSDFVDFCWNIYPGKDYYISYLMNDLLNPMFGIKRSSTLGSGLDESGKRVWLKLSVKFRDLSYSDYELKILRFIDPVKNAGRGYVDEIHLVSFRNIWKVSPQPTRMLVQSVDWINTDVASAPLNYEVYLYALISIKVRVEGIPSDTSVSILINEMNLGSIGPGRYIEKTLPARDYTIKVQPDMIMYNEDTRYRCRNNIYYLTVSGEVVFRYIAEHRVKISVQPQTSGAGLTIDGIYYSFEKLPFEDWWEEGSSHRIIADKEGPMMYVSELERRLVRFQGWNDGTIAYEKTISLSRPLNLVAIYDFVTQYYVNARSNYGRVTGSGWYNKGEKIEIQLENYVLEGQKAVVYLSSKEKMVFQGWSGDLTSPNTREVLIVDSPKIIEAVWKKQYYVEIITDYGNVRGSGWYDEGDIARIALDEDTVYSMDGRTRYIFNGWSGDYTGREKEFSVNVNKPLLIKSTWFTQYLVEIYTVPIELADKTLEFREKWFTAGDQISTVIENEVQVSAETKYVFVRWVADGETSFSREIRKIVDKPIEIRVEYEPWYYVWITSEYGTVYGSGWYRAGSQTEISVEPKTVGFLITHIFDGWYLDGRLISKDAILRLTVNEPLILTAKWKTEYTGLILLAVIVFGSVIVSTSFIKLKGEPLYRTLYRIIERKTGRLLRIWSSEKRLKEKLKKLEELYRKGEISEEAYMRVRHELESELAKKKPPKE